MGCVASNQSEEPTDPVGDKQIKVDSLTFYRSDRSGNPTEAVDDFFYTTGLLSMPSFLFLYPCRP